MSSLPTSSCPSIATKVAYGKVRELACQATSGIPRELTVAIGDHMDQLVDVKLMVIKRFDPELANRVFLDMGQRELKFIQNFGFFFGFALGIPVAALTHFVTFWWLLPILGVAVGRDGLLGVALVPQEADAGDRHVQIADRLHVIAGEDAEPSGVDRQRRIEPVLHAEVSDGHREPRP